MQCPTLVFHAEGDAAVGIEQGRELAAAIPGARFESLRSEQFISSAQLQAKNSFLANLAVFKTSNQMAGALLDQKV